MFVDVRSREPEGESAEGYPFLAADYFFSPLLARA